MEKTYAPGAPGVAPTWARSSKSGIGKALNTASEVSFTLSRGILTEIYFPREDIACTRDLGLLITDGKDFFSEEKKDAHHSIEMLEEGIPAYRIQNTCHHNRYEIIKEILTDPIRDTVLQKTIFKPAHENGEHTLHIYAILAPHLNNEGEHNSGWLGEYKGIPMLFAENDGLCLALACSAPWLKRSVGYVGRSDGWTDIHQHKTMQWEYEAAEDGNIALTGEIDWSAGGEFLLAVGFGRSADEAANHARGSILDGFDSARKGYIHGWETWMKKMNNGKGRYFKISSAVLRTHEAKIFPGGILASLSIPWGNVRGDSSSGGYHLVWPRDLVESAGGFMALKAEEDALRILNYLMSTQEADGSWPQNMWLEGLAYWKGIQMDQVALPILLTYKCYERKALSLERLKTYWPVIKNAIGFIIKNGPYTEQDRWEEEKGYTPFTIAAQIAGLITGAELADLNNEPGLAEYCRETADCWNDRIENWLYVTGTSLADRYGVEGYYIRTNPYKDIPANELGDRSISLKNNNDDKQLKLTELICVDALSLVRFGLRAADDPKIVNTVKVIDALLKVDTPGGPGWHRYNHDGYGEQENGEPFSGKGIGRAWPLLTGERAHYEIALGNFEEAENLLKAMDEFTNNGLLSEQIWDTDNIPEKDLYFGKHSGSAIPLTWAHSEYIKLCVSLEEKEVFDSPLPIVQRYLYQKKISSFESWRFDSPLNSLEAGKTLRIEVLAKATIRWTDDDWKTNHSTETTDKGVGVWVADLAPVNNEADHIAFTFYWPEAGHWEQQNYRVAINRDR